MNLFNRANTLFIDKYQLKNHNRSKSVSISNGTIKIRIKLSETGDPIIISTEKKFTGWYRVGFILSLLVLNVLGGFIYWMIFKASDEDVKVFGDEVIIELKKIPTST